MTEEKQTLFVERVAKTEWITFQRTEQLNAMSTQMLREIAAALESALADDAVRTIVLTGSGRAFCAGADLKEVAGAKHAPGEPDLLDLVDHTFGLMRHGPKPVIAAVNGLAMAGGLEMVMACDLVFAAESAQLGDAHSNFGVFPGAGGAAILPRRIGLNRAKYLLFSGENVSARDMMDWGLVNKVVADEELRDAVQEFTDKLADKSPAVLRRMKAVANRSLDVDETAALSEEMLNLRAHMRSWDMHEGLSAFNEKRKPQFRGY
ncbi:MULTISPECIES: enoyl-CoA hydratase/isomerase family protein [Paracoccaceae]|jgi:enoyl-CoA hydratase/carnithine racemase|uniref:Enoyl-CoA hydratase/isomerase family protein n=1 Tax=Sedimentitalea todarodis TaxID=1631240 RepID=A0ABU3VF12_9RHOB|nr:MULTISPECIES: enoyl-CoA hydratase/isomerase family protein [Paracoccaceae]MDU9004678.1 enoyl-CoA hydratase/isomerase family protein [Sedimentitalea todarodis]